MPRISRQSIDDLKLRIPIEDVVASAVSLKRSGKNFVGLSPFSNEKTPSFFVLPEKSIYKCFSSGKAGDIFSFIQETEKLEFNEAIEILAERFNIPLTYEEGGAPSKQERSLRRELLEIHDQAADFFHQTLLKKDTDSSVALEYWVNQRGFTIELAKEFKIGFAPTRSQELNRRLLAKGFSTEAIRECGLFYTSERDPDPERFRNRFRGRLMIPIRDRQDQIVAFTARQLAVTPEDDRTREAKYINSPETPLFHKSDLVFNLERARKAVDEENRFLLVEGQLDAIRCWESGFQATVAPQGTSITEAQMRLLRRYSPNLTVVLDGDSAGKKAALRMLPLALRAGLEVHFASLPTGDDPDSFLSNHGKHAFAEVISQGLEVAEFAADALLPPKPSPRDRANALQAYFQILAECDSSVVQQGYLDQAIGHFQVDRDAALRDFQQFLRRSAPRKSTAISSSPPAERTKPKLTTAESELLLIVLHNEELATPIAHLLDPLWIDQGTTEGRVLGSVLAEIGEGHLNIRTNPQAFLEQPDDINTFFNHLADERRFEEPLIVGNNCISKLYKRHLRNRMIEIDQQIANLDQASEQFDSLLMERSRLKKAQLSSDIPALGADSISAITPTE